MKNTVLVLALASSPAVLAQFNPTFSGPDVLTRGAGSVGRRSGQDVDLRMFGNVTGVYDDGLLPFAIDSSGGLKPADALYGAEVGLGAYGRHTFRRSVLGLDYAGNYRHYTEATNLNGLNQALTLGYTRQQSRRLLLDFRQTAGTQTFGAAFGLDAALGSDSIVNQNSLLFDNRITFVQSSGTATYALSNRTAFSVGGTGYTVRRKAQALIGVNGYNLNGALQHQLSRRTTIGLRYSHVHFDFHRAFGESDINAYTGTYRLEFGRTWTLRVEGGILTTAVQGVQMSALDPTIAALLGVSSVRTIFYKENMLPTGEFSIQKDFRRSTFSANYVRTISPGNGVYLTSRQENYGAAYSYTGFRRWGLSLNVNSNKMDALGQQLQTFNQKSATGSISYRLGGSVNLTATYARRRQEIVNNVFQQDSSRIAFGIYFSPGEIPISFH